ncbi:MAG: hypothetical protein ACP5KN_07290 [Armatimonadota bacterium]
MRRRVMWIGTAAVAVALIATGVTVALAQQGQGRRGGQRGMMGDMMYLERTWTAVSFQLECTSEQLEQLRPTYREQLQLRNESIQAAMQAQDFQGVREAIVNCRTALEAKLQEVLTDQQWTKLQQLLAPAMFGGPRGPRGAGGQGQ